MNHVLNKFSFNVMWEEPSPPNRYGCWQLSLFENDKEVDNRCYVLIQDGTKFSEEEMLDEARERGASWVAAQENREENVRWRQNDER